MEILNHPPTTDLTKSEATAVVYGLMGDYKEAVLGVPQLVQGAARVFMFDSLDAEGHIGNNNYRFRAGLYGRYFSLAIERDSTPGQFRGWDIEVIIQAGSNDPRDPIKEASLSYRSDKVYITPYPR